MQIISGISEFQLNKPTAVAMGKFDGIHLGHRLLADKILTASDEKFLKSVIFTFNPSPEAFFSGQPVQELTTVAEKRRAFEKMGIDILIEFPMNKLTASTEPDLFIEKYICDQMRAKYIVAGTDVSFGDKGMGNADLLIKRAAKFNYECELIDKVTYEGKEISSTRVRRAVADGDLELAAKLLGSPYMISGTVSHGRHLGSQMGMPTANLIVAPDKLVGPKGVYFSLVTTARGKYFSVSNVGVKPTISDNELLCVESYIYDFEEDIYGKYIEVELLKFSRPEMKFDSVDELKAQMQRDIAAGREYHGI